MGRATVWGVTNLPLFLIEEDLANGSLVPILPDWSPTPIAMWALWAKDRLTEHLVKALLKEISCGLEAATQRPRLFFILQ